MSTASYAFAAHGVAAESRPAWPAADTMILRSRTIQAGTPDARLSRFGDAVWVLQPAHADAHHVVNSVHWSRFPPALVLPFKAFALAVLDHPYPPDLLVERGGERMAIDTIGIRLRDLRVFAEWMGDQDLDRVSAVTDRWLDAYRGHVLALAKSARRKAELLGAVRILWAYRDHLPGAARLATANPWHGASGHSLAQVPPASHTNKTPRIAPATMGSLLAWSLRMVEDFGPDIADAWAEFRELRAGTHPSQRRFGGLAPRDRLALFLADARRDGTALPGRHRHDGTWEVNQSHLRRLLGQRPGILTAAQLRQVQQSGLPIATGSYLGAIRGQLDGTPWRHRPITVDELPDLVRLLAAACFTTTCYLSGMRPGEALNLRRGCRQTDPETGQLLLQGRRGKGHGRLPWTAATTSWRGPGSWWRRCTPRSP